MTTRKKRLDDLVELRPEKSNGVKDSALPYVGLEHIAQGMPQLLGSLPSSASVSINSQFEKNDILFGKLRPNLRKSIRAPFAGYCSTDILVLRPMEGIDPAFAGHVFQWENVFNAATATAAGTKMPRTSWNELGRFRVSCPDTITEQHYIAVALDAIDSAIAKTAAVIAKLNQVRAGLLHDLLTCGLDDNGELRDPLKHPEQFQDSPLGRIPKFWNCKNLPSVATWQNGQPFPSSQYRNHGIRLLRPGNLPITEFVSWSNLETCLPESWSDSASDYLVRGEELVMNLTAQSLEDGFLGRVCMTRENERCLLNQRLARFRSIEIHLAFLFWCLRGPHFRKQMDRIPQGTKVQHLYNRDLERAIVAVPKSLDEQTAIAETLFAGAEQIESEVCEVAKLIRVKAGVTSDLLTGRVPVPETIATETAQ